MRRPCDGHLHTGCGIETTAARGVTLRFPLPSRIQGYVEAKDTREVVDIAELNAELKNTVTKITELRAQIDAIVAEIEGEEQSV